jgi:hypothetical protein
MSLNWTALRRVYVPDTAEHTVRAADLGLSRPPDAFEQLFHDHHDDQEIGSVLRFVDWAEALWGAGRFFGRCLAAHRRAACLSTGRRRSPP